MNETRISTFFVYYIALPNQKVKYTISDQSNGMPMNPFLVLTFSKSEKYKECHYVSPGRQPECIQARGVER